MKLTKMIYLASPYSCMDPSAGLIPAALIRQARYDAVTKCAGILEDTYPYAFIQPITQSHNTSKYHKKKDTGFKAWETRDLTFVSRCDEVWVLGIEGWSESIGVQAEISFAVVNNIPVKFIDPVTYKVKKMRIK